MKPGDVIKGDNGERFLITDGPVTTWVVGRAEACKSAQCSGGHYHCTRCGAVTGMTGHATLEDCGRARAAGLADDDWVLDG